MLGHLFSLLGVVVHLNDNAFMHIHQIENKRKLFKVPVDYVNGWHGWATACVY